jgi:hypothetical protein
MASNQYRLAKIYRDTGRKKAARELAKKTIEFSERFGMRMRYVTKLRNLLDNLSED